MSDSTQTPSIHPPPDISPKVGDIIKVSVGETLRRIPVTRFWNAERDHFAYTRFTQHVAALLAEYHGYSVPPFRVAFYYQDSDGEEITASSPTELQEGWSDMRIPDGGNVFRVSARLKPVAAEADGAANTNDHHSRSGPTSGGGDTLPPGATLRLQVQALFESLATVLMNLMTMVQRGVYSTVQTVSGGSASIESDRQRSGDAKKPSRHPRPRCLWKEKMSGEFDPNFIHLRHTCDGCECSPIIGIRYHATNRSDYDYCAQCFENYKGTDIKFEPEQLVRDLRFNRPFGKWGKGGPRRFGRCHSSPGNKRFCKEVYPPESAAVPEQPEFEKNMAEAIRRSLSDLDDKRRDDSSDTNGGNNNSNKEKNGHNDAVKELEDIVNDGLAQVSNIIVAVAKDLSNAASKDGKLKETPPLNDLTAIVNSFVESFTEVTPVVHESTKNATARQSSGLSSQSSNISEARTSTTGKETAEVSTNTTEVKKDDAATITEEASHLDATEEKAHADHTSDDWNLVSESGDLEASAIASAMGVIGSALLQEDLARSTETISAISTGTSLKSDTTCAESKSNAISLAAFQRWSNEIKQLRELGFTNDVTSVEVLERLAAANIGVESDEEVTVEKAVHYLLKLQEK